MKEYSKEEFLNKIYVNMHKEISILKSSNPNDNKNERIRKYLERLKKVHIKALEKDKLDLIKHFYYEKYIIKKENIKEEYFKHLEQIALDRGYGHVRYTEELKNKEKERIIEEQKSSLDSWIDYFVSNDTNMYEVWYKYYVFRSIVKLGEYDKEKKVYNKRTEYTISMFPEINREAIALTYDYIIDNLEGKEIEDKKLEELIENGSFKKIYEYIIRKLEQSLKEKGESIKGEWIKYNQGEEPTRLVNSLKGKGTGWCTAGIETARIQLENGDFYVYYTYDKKGNATIPRIAIRMEGNQIGEIRGVAENQNLESEMKSILEEKLEEFPDRDKYKKKVKDMEELTKIYNKYKREELNKEELRFIYEIDNKIDGFGYKEDPRIEEILDGRNIKKDLSYALNCKESQIGLTKEEALSGECIYYRGDLKLRNLTTAEGLTLPQTVGGNLDLRNLATSEGLTLPQTIGGYLKLSSLTTAEGLTLPQIVSEDLDLSSLTTAEGLTLPQTIGGDLKLSSLTTAKGLTLPQIVGGYLDLSSLTTAKGLTLPQIVGVYLDLGGLTTAEGLTLPQTIGGGLYLNSLTTAKGLTLPQTIGGYLYLNSLTTIEGLELPENFNLDKLIIPKDLKEQLIERTSKHK